MRHPCAEPLAFVNAAGHAPGLRGHHSAVVFADNDLQTVFSEWVVIAVESVGFLRYGTANSKLDIGSATLMPLVWRSPAEGRMGRRKRPQNHTVHEILAVSRSVFARNSISTMLNTTPPKPCQAWIFHSSENRFRHRAELCQRMLSDAFQHFLPDTCRRPRSSLIRRSFSGMVQELRERKGKHRADNVGPWRGSFGYLVKLTSSS